MLPGLVLTVPGARTGRPRTAPLACMPEGEVEGAWIVVGSNFGRTGHPAWTANLLARGGEAVVNWRGRDIPVRATLLEGEERARVWEAALAFWPPYAAYERRVGRQIRLCSGWRGGSRRSGGPGWWPGASGDADGGPPAGVRGWSAVGETGRGGGGGGLLRRLLAGDAEVDQQRQVRAQFGLLHTPGGEALLV